MASFSKVILSGSVNGKQIVVSSETSSSATFIHAPEAGTGSMDEVWLYAYNNATSSLSCSFYWGGTSEPQDVTRTVIAAQSGRNLIFDGKIIQNGLNISAYAEKANYILLDGFVNRITLTNETGSSPIIEEVAEWANNVVFNGGGRPSYNTQVAMSTFYRGLHSGSLFSKMRMVNCVAPDNVIAATTDLIGPSFRRWNSSSITLTNLSEGINGSGGSSFWDSGFNPYRNLTHSSSAGITLYVSTVTGSTNGYDIGCTTGNGTTIFAMKICDTAGLGGFSNFYCFTANTTSLSSVACPGRGMYSGNRISESIYLYYGNSTASLTPIVSGSGTTNGFGSVMDVTGLYVGAVRLLASSVFGPTTNTYSFIAVHDGLSSAEAQVLFELVQQMRQTFGGGYV